MWSAIYSWKTTHFRTEELFAFFSWELILEVCPRVLNLPILHHYINT
jgi:hypothetical protein